MTSRLPTDALKHLSTTQLLTNLTGITEADALFAALNGDMHALRGLKTYQDLANLLPIDQVDSPEKELLLDQHEQILALAELLRRIASPAPRRMLATPEAIADVVRPHASFMQEEVWVVTCDSARPVPGVLNLHHIYTGGRAAVTLSPPDIFRPAVVDQASAMILVHTHPNDDACQTLNDITTTKHYRELAKLLEVTLLDHIIISRQGYFSMVKNGALAPP